MDVISLSKSKFKTLSKVKLSKYIFNTESEIFDFRYKGKDKIFKKWYINEGINLANKMYTLEMLDYFRKYFPTEFCLPECFVIVGGSVQGFIMPKIDGINLNVLLNDSKMDNKEQIFYLKKVGEILNNLSQIKKFSKQAPSFNINDVHASNFMVNIHNKTVSVIDLDSSRISSSIAFPAKYLTERGLIRYTPKKYERAFENQNGYIIADDNSDLHCYNLMILDYLYKDNVNRFSIEEFYNYLNYLDSIGINKELLSDFANIVINKDVRNPYLHLERLTDNQIARSSKYVYTRVRQG